MNRNQLTSKDKIDILLKEYDTLRQEILSRIKYRYLIFVLFWTFLGFLILRENSVLQGDLIGINTKAFIGLAGSIILLSIWWFYGYLIANLGKRISEIEERVNEIAEEDLLVWETLRGWGRWSKYLGFMTKATKNKV